MLLNRYFDNLQAEFSEPGKAGYRVHPIGFFKSRYEKKYDAPRQVSVQEPSGGLSEIQLLPGNNFEQALQDLHDIEHLWVIFWFHQAQHWKPKILPPRGRAKRGVFATRAPHRPNPIGMSVVKNYGVRGLSLIISECDILDGTPVLDIKPYIARYDSVPDSFSGWLAEEQIPFRLILSERETEKLHFLTERGVLLYDQINNVLVFDPLPHPYRRIKRSNNSGDNLFIFAYRAWRVYYSINQQTKELSLLGVMSAYAGLEEEVGAEDEELSLHYEFIARFGNNFEDQHTFLDL